MTKIIVADDNKDVLNIVSEFLKMQPNMEVVQTFSGGKELLSYLESAYLALFSFLDFHR